MSKEGSQQSTTSEEVSTEFPDLASRAVFELGPDAQVIHDGFTVSDANGAAERLIGATDRSEIIGRPLHDFVHPDDHGALDDRLAKIRSGNAPEAGLNLRIIAADSSTIVVEIFSSLLPDDLGVLSVLRDVTERDRLQRSAAENRHRLETALAAGRMGTWSIDAEHRTFAGDPFTYDLFGLQHGSDDAMPLDDVLSQVHHDDRAIVRDRIQAAFADSASEFEHEYRAVTEDGTVRWVHMRGRVAERSLSGIVTDVSAQMEATRLIQESEAKFKNLAQSSPAGIYILQEGRFVYVNPALSATLGFDAQDMVGTEAVEYIVPEDRAIMLENLRLRTEGEPGVFYDLRARTKDGGEVVLSVLGSLTQLAGKPAMIGTALNVTDIRKAQRRIRQSEARYQALSQLLSSYGYSCRVTRDGQRLIDWVSESMKGVFVDGVAEFEADGWTTYVHSEDRHLVREFEQTLLQGDPANVGFRIVRRDGAVRWMRAYGVPELDESESRVERINVAGQDVTEQQMIEGELTRQRDRAEQMSRLKDTFLANMSHEIRTPLASIIGAADILHSEVASEAHDLVSFIRRGGERLMETLSSVLDLAQLQGRSIELHPETFDLVSEIGRVVDLFRPRASSKELTLELVSRTSKSIYVSTDRVALGRVIANLLSNALKFTHQGGVTVRIGEANRRIDIDVIDTGVGIPPEFLPDIYEEFSQASVGHTRSHEGAGLGLAITRRLVGLLGGTIDVIASSNEGTTFRVSLPHTTSGPRGLPDQLDDPALPARDMQILVVDDDPTVGEIVRRYLETNAVVHVADGRTEAAEFAAERHCDLVLMDINLKRGQRGDEVMHSMRMIKGYETVPFIALTAYALPGDRERFLASGFDGYVSKPFRKDHLIRTINSVLK